MYRRLTKRQQDAQAKKLDAMRRGRDRARMAREPQGRMPQLPELRREVVVIDFDSGQPVAHPQLVALPARPDDDGHGDRPPPLGWTPNAIRLLVALPPI